MFTILPSSNDSQQSCRSHVQMIIKISTIIDLFAFRYRHVPDVCKRKVKQWCALLPFAYLERFPKAYRLYDSMCIRRIKERSDKRFRPFLTAPNCSLVTKFEKDWSERSKKLDKLFEQHSICGKGRPRTWNANMKRKQEFFSTLTMQTVKCKGPVW